MVNNDDKGPVHLRHLLGPSSGKNLKGLVQRARALDAVAQELRSLLPLELNAGWALGRIDDREIVLVAESSAWATRLRYSRPLILSAARKATGMNLQTLTIKITPPKREYRPRRKARMGSSAARTLRQAADALGSQDRRLSQALRRLARNGEEE